MTAKRKRTISQPLIRILFLIYTGIMIWLLFVQRMDAVITNKTENINLVPFETLKLYWGLLSSGSSYYFRQAVINLVGNVVMFIPFGVFVPQIWPSCRKFLLFLLWAVLVIISIEVLQYITGLGSCDIDDFILNFPGMLLGYIISLRLPAFRR